jgi:hypothetical protein
MRIATRIAAVIIPGGSAFLRKSHLRGALFLLLWLVPAEAYVLVTMTKPAGLPASLPSAAWMTAAGLWVLNATLALIHIMRSARARRDKMGEKLFSEALQAHLCGKDAEAEKLLRRLLAIDASDPDALFLRAQTAARLGKTRRAKRLFRKCRDFDEKGKWTWEIVSAMENL